MMITKDKRERQNAEWVRTHTLNQEQFKKLVDAKISRAYNLHQAIKKREMSLQKHR